MDWLIAALLGSTAANILGSYLGSRASGQAAETQAGAATEAAQLQAQTAQEQIAALERASQQSNTLQELMYLLGRQDVEPWRQVGGGALMTLQDLLQPEGYLAQGYPQFTGQMQFQRSDVMQDPGFDFRMQEGAKALERSAAARGGLLSGATAKELERYAQDYSSGEYQNAYQRTYGEAADKYNQALERYRTNYAVNEANQGNLFNRLATLAGYGQSGAQTAANLGSNYATQAGQTALNTAGNVANVATGGAARASDYLTQAANARASGYVGGANAWQQGLASPTNALLTYALLQRPRPLNQP